jgi:hypothetical protein
MAAGFYETRLWRVWLSPTGKTVVFLGISSSGNMRSFNASVDVLGVRSWAGEPLVLR